MKLYIIGNGFDLHHGIQTSYQNYREYLRQFYFDVYNSYERLMDYSGAGFGECWNNIESALTIDYETLASEIINTNYPDMMSDKDTYADAEIEMMNMTDFIYEFTGEAFVRWLYSIFLPVIINPNCFFKNKIPLDYNSDFINFNYTETLEYLYKINSNRIFHIHGTLRNACALLSCQDFTNLNDELRNKFIKTEIQFGSAFLDALKIEKHLEAIYGEDDFYGASLSNAVTCLSKFANAASKNVTVNINRLNCFIYDKIYNEVVIMGHSLCEADEMYFEKVLVPRFGNVQWTFYCHNDSDLYKVSCFIKKFNLSNTTTVRW